MNHSSIHPVTIFHKTFIWFSIDRCVRQHEWLFRQPSNEPAHDGEQKPVAESNAAAGRVREPPTEGHGARPLGGVHQFRENPHPHVPNRSPKIICCIQQVRSFQSPPHIRKLMEYVPGKRCRDLTKDPLDGTFKCDTHDLYPSFADFHRNSNFYDPKLARIGLGK